jgi:hypothetical protein
VPISIDTDLREMSGAATRAPPPWSEVNMHSIRTRLRRALAVIEAELSQLEAGPCTTHIKLQTAWLEVASLGNIGAATRLRGCPACQHFVGRDAIRCRNCHIPLWPDVEMSLPPTWPQVSNPPSPRKTKTLRIVREQEFSVFGVHRHPPV